MADIITIIIYLNQPMLKLNYKLDTKCLLGSRSSKPKPITKHKK